MSGTIEKSVDKAIKYGAVFAEVVLPHPQGNEQDIDGLQLNPIAKAVFGVASVTFEVCAHYKDLRGRSNA